jgi:DNA replication protein DnaD
MYLQNKTNKKKEKEKEKEKKKVEFEHFYRSLGGKI